MAIHCRALSVGRDVCMVLAMKALKHSGNSRASHVGDWPHLRRSDGQLPSPGMAGEVAEILPFPWAFGQFWRKYGVDHTGVSSAVSS